MGSKVKYELDKKSGLIKADRTLFSSVHYPANYGFLPQTYCDDDDPLDILVLSQEAMVPLCLLRAKPIGLMEMTDQGKSDNKVIAVHYDDPEYAHYTSINELPPHRLKQVRRFFEDYKILENKTIKVENFLGAEACLEIIKESMQLYQAEKDKLKAKCV
jgi:inorganic pyrophosphatase